MKTALLRGDDTGGFAGCEAPFFVSRTRCGILHAAPQSRDHTKRWSLLRPRLSSAPFRKSYTLRCVRGTHILNGGINRCVRGFPDFGRLQNRSDLLSLTRAAAFHQGAKGEFIMAKGQMRSNKEKKKPKADKNLKKGGAAPSPFASGKAPAGQNPYGKK